MSSLRTALEEAVAANFDDLAAHSAYADYLQEQGDPRGEFIQVQLALEDSSRGVQERQRLQQRENELLDAHQKEWLGDLAERLLPRQPGGISRVRWMRGWLHEVDLGKLTPTEARGLANCPSARMLQRLCCRPSLLSVLLKCSFLSCLRSLRVGKKKRFDPERSFHDAAAHRVTAVLDQTPNLEELRLLGLSVDMNALFSLTTLTRLRCLELSQVPRRYPLEVLAGNPAFSSLQQLTLHPLHLDPGDGCFLPRSAVAALLHSPHFPALRHLHLHASDLGDAGCTEIVCSGILKRLHTLDLTHGRITDAGVRILCACPDVRRLNHLSLVENELTSAGCEELGRLGGFVLCQGQNAAGSNDYLYSWDME